ncbi:hypothetical protein EJB05_26562, partial [Eragrostis curvula]
MAAVVVPGTYAALQQRLVRSWIPMIQERKAIRWLRLVRIAGYRLPEGKPFDGSALGASQVAGCPRKAILRHRHVQVSHIHGHAVSAAAFRRLAGTDEPFMARRLTGGTSAPHRYKRVVLGHATPAATLQRTTGTHLKAIRLQCIMPKAGCLWVSR